MAAQGAWDELTKHEEKEAMCLRKDVNEVMRRVEEHNALLDPKNVVNSLKGVRASGATSPSTSTTTTGIATIPVSPGDLSNLRPPVKSLCDNAV